ncbi:C25 family cysteine peptidase [Planctomycetota bacterium]
MHRLGSNSQPKRRCMLMIAGMVWGMLMLCEGVFAGNLRLSEAKNIANLTLTKVYIEKLPGSSMKPSARTNEWTGSQDVSTKSLAYSIDVSDCTLSQKTDGRDCLFINGLRSLTKPGRPQLPMMTLTARLDKNAEVLGIEVVDGTYHEILDSVSFAPAPEPQVWMRPKDVPEQTRIRFELVREKEPIEGYFPGEMAVYNAGRDNTAVYVNVKAYPVQYAPKSNKAVLISNAKINIYYTVPTSRTEARGNGDPVDSAESVIVCPASLKPAAERLKDFHIDKENVSTSVITTEEIDAGYLPAADPPFLGYSSTVVGKDKIVGYDYELAKKIIAYLRDQEQHPNLTYVTLFGDGLLVPPSYYINEMAMYEWYDFESYHDWIPTDFLYSSPDYDYVANYRVGRLPVSDADQAASIVDKIERWHTSLSWDWFKRASVVGGRPFGTPWYYGELSSVDTINKDFLNGMEVAKYYYTAGTYDVNHVKPLLISEDSGWLYHVDHGSGYQMGIGEEFISSSDVMISETPRTRPFNPEAPVVLSVACINGAYDTDMTVFEYQPEFDAIPYPTSFGEATVLSNAGGIAYVGGSRLNYAGWDMFYDEGRLLAHHYYMTQICNSVLDSYHSGAGRIGDMTYAALRRYAQDTLIGYSSERETLFGFVLLGDPVLSLPAPQPGLSCRKPYLAALGPDGYLSDDVPVFRNLPVDQSQTIDVVSSSDSPGVDVTSIYTWRDAIVKKDCLNGSSVTHTFTPTECGSHLVRAAAADGKEGWLYVNTQFEFVPSSDVLLIDADAGADYEQFYTGAIGNLGRTCDIWEIGAREVVHAETLGQYDIVVWFLPSSDLNDWEKNACGTYLDNGGKLFITGQNIGSYITSYGNRFDHFYQNYLHAEWMDWAYAETLAGQPRDPIGSGMSITIWGGDGANNQYSTDEIEPIPPAVPVFSYEPGSEAAIRVDTGTYKVVYFGFGFEGIDSQPDRDEVMRRVLHWLGQS